MSKNEEKVAKSLGKLKIKYERQKPIPLEEYPWKTPRTKTNHKVDFYIPDKNIYIEVKGWMTIYSMAQMMWLSNNLKNYYIFQLTEEDWDPFLDSPIKSENNKLNNYDQQLNEINYFMKNNNKEISEISKSRIQSYIKIRIEQYEEWNKKWY